MQRKTENGNQKGKKKGKNERERERKREEKEEEEEGNVRWEVGTHTHTPRRDLREEETFWKNLEHRKISCGCLPVFLLPTTYN